MKNFYNRIAQIALALNCEYKEIPYGIMVYTPDSDYNKYRLLINKIFRIKNAHFESNPYAQSVSIYHINDYNVKKESEDKKQKIVDYFFLELRKNGRDVKAAEKAQKIYAESIGAIKEYNQIYA